MKLSLTVVALISVSGGLAAAETCADAYRPEYQTIWELERGQWNAACAKPEDSAQILAEAKKVFAASCAETARPSIATALATKEKVSELCAQGVPGRQKIPKPPGGAQARATALALGAQRVGAVDAETGAFVDGDIAGLYGERTGDAGSAVPVPPPDDKSGPSAARANGGPQVFKTKDVPAPGDAAARKAAIATLEKRIMADQLQEKDAAVAEAKRLLHGMLDGADQSVVSRLVAEKVHIVIVPADKKMTDIAPFKKLKGKKTFDGRKWDDVRGAADVTMDDGAGIAVAIPEENLTTKKPDDKNRYPKDYVFVHEFGHMIQDHGLPKDAAAGSRTPTRAESEKVYAESMKRKAKTGLGKYADANDSEAFAQATSAFFGANNHDQGAADLKKVNRPMYDLLVRIYGPPRNMKP